MMCIHSLYTSDMLKNLKKKEKSLIWSYFECIMLQYIHSNYTQEEPLKSQNGGIPLSSKTKTISQPSCSVNWPSRRPPRPLFYLVTSLPSIPTPTTSPWRRTLPCRRRRHASLNTSGTTSGRPTTDKVDTWVRAVQQGGGGGRVLSDILWLGGGSWSRSKFVVALELTICVQTLCRCAWQALKIGMRIKLRIAFF